MKYIAIWRTLMVVLAATIFFAVLFYWWEKHLFVIGSRDLSNFMIKWWWLAVVILLSIINVVGSVLILIGSRPRFLLRLLFALAAYPFPPVLLIYWLAFVERFRPNNSFKPRPLRGSA